VHSQSDVRIMRASLCECTLSVPLEAGAGNSMLTAAHDARVTLPVHGGSSTRISNISPAAVRRRRCCCCPCCCSAHSAGATLCTRRLSPRDTSAEGVCCCCWWPSLPCRTGAVRQGSDRHQQQQHSSAAGQRSPPATAAVAGALAQQAPAHICLLRLLLTAAGTSATRCRSLPLADVGGGLLGAPVPGCCGLAATRESTTSAHTASASASSTSWGSAGRLPACGRIAGVVGCTRGRACTAALTLSVDRPNTPHGQLLCGVEAAVAIGHAQRTRTHVAPSAHAQRVHKRVPNPPTYAHPRVWGARHGA
jgi:hypothetical protein